jgi:hypothetical protein
MKRRLLTIILVILIAFSLPLHVLAQEYYFSLDVLTVDVYWNSDGTSSLDYYLTFTNQPGGHSIEFVDVGMPNGAFDVDSITADIDGSPLSISLDFQGEGTSGFAVEMGSHAIPPGSTGTVHVYVGRVSDVLYNDDKDSDYTSAVFAPLYYLSNVITGSTDMTVTYHLPPGVQPEEPRWHSAPSGFPSEPETFLDDQGRVAYRWYNPAADASRQHKFGASFPKTYIPADSIVTVQLPSLSISPDAIFILLCLCFFGFMGLGIPTIAALSARRRKLQYLPPKITIEGHGIKRGLTAVEAAILMEQPLDKVMTMILFGAVKKNSAEVLDRDPLTLKVTSPLPDGLYEYEVNFLNAFKDGDKKTRRNLLQGMTVSLVKSVSEKMKGFSRRETIDYYKSIIEKAWAQVAAADTPEVQSKMFEESLEWTMLDRDYDERTRRTFQRPIIVPMWWGRYDPVWRGGGTTTKTVSAPSTGKGSSSLPGADFAASVVTGVQGFSQSVIGNVTEFTSRVTKVTNPPPPPPKSSGGFRGGGGGRSCACACACAGCACACAGGGR